jgi:hypothetical protein
MRNVIVGLAALPAIGAVTVAALSWGPALTPPAPRTRTAYRTDSR